VTQRLRDLLAETPALHLPSSLVIGPAFIDTHDLPVWPKGLPGLVAACIT